MILFFHRSGERQAAGCLLLCFFLLQLSAPVKAFTLRKINQAENLSSRRVYSLYQDDKGILWIGTARGIDRYDGKRVLPYDPQAGGSLFAGSKIDKIRQTADGCLWLQTSRGLHQIAPDTAGAEAFALFDRIAFWDDDDRGALFLLQANACLYYKLKEQTSFEQMFMPALRGQTVVDFFSDKAGRLWIVRADGVCLCLSVRQSGGHVDFLPSAGYRHPTGIRYGTHDDDGQAYFIDTTGALFEFDTSGRKAFYIGKVSREGEGDDTVTSLLKFHDDYFIGFKTRGLTLLKKKDGQASLEQIEAGGGINCLYRDKYQDIVWIGTDRQGVYAYAAGPYAVRSFRLSDFPFPMRRPVSALWIDTDHTLWVGSRGDGILRVFDFQPDKALAAHRTEWLTTSGGRLPDNLILSFASSREGNFWIGSEKGLSYFIRHDDRIVAVEWAGKREKAPGITAVYEQDSLLWIATSGEGVIKAGLAWREGKPAITLLRRFTTTEREEYANCFEQIYPENDSVLWFTNKKKGLFRLHTTGSQLENVPLEGYALREINGICKDVEGDYLIGTNVGLIKYRPSEQRIRRQAADGPALSVYGIWPADGSACWVSTNRGLWLYDSGSETGRMYDYHDGLDVGELLEGACFKEGKTGLFLGGGTDGFAALRKDYFDEGQHYMPPVYFKTITLRGKTYPIETFLSRREDDVRLELGPEQNSFTLSFAAVDHLNGHNYTYYYRLDGQGKEWTYNGNSDLVSFADLRPGNYVVYVKYHNRALGKESYRYKLAIRIRPPWYASSGAYAAYVLLGAGLGGCGAGLARRRVRRKKAERRQKAEQKRKEEIYESKLAFFTHLSHEFCTPLTLIYGPCNRLMAQRGLPDAARKYASVIRQNAERLNRLIQELIEFNRIESGYKKPVVAMMDIAAAASRLIASFEEAAESHAVGVEKVIPSRLEWPSDKGFIETVLLNLLSNAFKYATNEKKVRVEIGGDTEQVWIRVSNTGKGIAPEDVPVLFDRYRVLQYFEQKDKSAWGGRHGLGLAIAYRLVRLLEGTIEVESVPDAWTHFRVKLPYLEPAGQVLGEAGIAPSPDYQADFSPALQIPVCEPDGLKPTLLIVDDEMEIRWFLFDLFQKEYNVLAAASADEALMLLKSTHPDLILSDVLMPGMDGLTFSKHVKADETTAHIPLILLSARGDVEGQTRGLDAGAELYITKPFHVDYIKSSVRRLLERKEHLRAYFASPLSAYELEKGKLSHADDRKFVREMLKIVNRNIRNKELSAAFLAEKMHLGLRTFYRRLEEAEGVPLTELITNCRLVKAADLLAKTRLTIDEVVFQSGFTNRSTFYRAFSKKYGCTPTAYRKERDTPAAPDG